MKLQFKFIATLLLSCYFANSQNALDINATLYPEKDKITITQTITYFNNTKDNLKVVYLNDWNNSFSSTKTPLAIRLADEFNTKLYFSKEKERGYTTIHSIKQNDNPVDFNRLEKQQDIIKVTLNKPLKAKESYTINLEYTLKIPSSKFTEYGVDKNNNYNLRYWYITPSIYNGTWQNYSNKDLDDLFLNKSKINLELKIPETYSAVSELNTFNKTHKDSVKIISFKGEERTSTKLYLKQKPNFKTFKTNTFNITTNIEEDNLIYAEKLNISKRIASFITQHLGNYPHDTLLLSQIDYKKNPIYGLNQLPSFIRPFSNSFQYELKLIKTALQNYLENTLYTNPRKDQWLSDGVQMYFLMKYIETYYPDTKLFGSLSKIWGLRAFHAADLYFNEQYNLGYMHMARTNRDQPLTMQKDSLLKFNKNIANKYKAGLGFQYLDDFINANILENTLKSFLIENKLQYTNSKEFEKLIKTKTSKNLNWFFEDFVSSRKKIDYRIKKVVSEEDSITFTVQNKRENTMPITLFKIQEDNIISKSWLTNITKDSTLTVTKENADKVVLNYDLRIPEFNQRNNAYKLNSSFFNRKPLQIRLFQDIEDPNYNQLFLMPLVNFRNIYDGVTLGLRAYNKTLLRKPLTYSFSPQYATKSQAITGSFKLFYRYYFDSTNLYEIVAGGAYKRESFAEGLFANIIRPSIHFKFRDKDDFRSNKRQSLQLRYYDINRDEDINDILEDNEVEPSYNVFNIKYQNSNFNLIDTNQWETDLQVGGDFGKLSLEYNYRKLFHDSRQFNFRLFAGTFLYNNTSENSDYFSFGLDRPTDYLFDYNYLGRTESSGIISQQLIIADGGFKSILEPRFANQWIATANVGTSIWRYFQVYGNIGFVKNKGKSEKFVYDFGLRLNLVQDYFEIYFPIYSNLGWEIGKENYDERIRFIFTVDPQSLFGLFRRKWY